MLLEIITGGGGGISAEAEATPTNGMYGFVDFSVSATKLTARIVNHAGTPVGGTWAVKPRPKRGRIARGAFARRSSAGDDDVRDGGTRMRQT